MTRELIKIESPNIQDLSFLELLKHTQESSLHELIKKTQSPEYLHWTKLKYKSWIPEGFTPQQFWALVKILRRGGQRFPIRDESNNYFTWTKLAHYDRQLHELDLNTGGRLADSKALSPEEKKSFISRGILEEAIASAQLEGAHTTREYAKKMIEEGRSPQNEGQRMIANNYQTMVKIEEEFRNQPMSLDLLFDMHRMLTEGTLEKEQIARFRTDEEDIVIANDENLIAHIPPKMEFVRHEIMRLIDYANNKDEKPDEFLHPVIKAISLHFWIGYLHPFVDGNGRLARALFYWYLLKMDYWTFAFIPVSTRIKKSAKQYAYAYIYSEQDDNDLTYFIDYNLRKIELARRDFQKYIDKKTGQNDDINTLSKRLPNLNYRQLSLVQYFIACPTERTNVTAMSKIYGISEVTAVSDLKTMLGYDLLIKKRLGKNVFYYPTEKLFSVTK